MTKLPVYEMVISDNPESEIEVSSVAFVEKPAIEKNFLAFKDLTLNFAVDNERRIVSGPAMVADTLIYRRDDNGEYNVFFSKETIEKIALKFFKKDYQKNLNLFHDPTQTVTGVTIFESFVSDKARKISPMGGFEDLPDGTWFISAKVENDEVWNKVKDGSIKGFSVEGIFSYIKKPKTPEEKVFEIITATLDKSVLLPETEGMSIIKDLIKTAKEKFNLGLAPAPLPAPAPAPAPAPTAAVFADYTLKSGTVVKCDTLAPGGTMMIGEIPAPAGEYEFADGTKVTVGEGGSISAVTPSPAMTQQQQVNTMNEALKKFAAGSPEDRVTNLEVVAKALMEYSFGWDMRRATEEATKAAAIEIYKTGFEEQKTKLSAAETKLADAEKLITKQAETITAIFDIVEKLAEVPGADPLERKTSFRSENEKSAQEKVTALALRLKTLKKAV